MEERHEKKRNAIIIGAASGIGFSTAKSFAECGFGLALADMDETRLREASETIRKFAFPLFVQEVDASDSFRIQKFVEEAWTKLGAIDVLVYSAGMGHFCPLVDKKTEDWDKEIAVNLSGAFYAAQSIAQKMIAQRTGGTLLFVSSTAASHNTNQVAAYCAAKAGLNMLVKCLASELGNHRIRVNAVMPGVIETNMTKPMLAKERYRSMLHATIPLGRWGKPDEVAALLTFLASDAASYINGESIAIDGGHSVQQIPAWWPLDYTKDFLVNWYEPFENYPYK